MRLNYHGRVIAEPSVRVGVIGCGSHAFRNVYPALQFTPLDLIATCDLDGERAGAYARRFGALRWYTDYEALLADDEVDAVLAVLDYDERRRPKYPEVACDCLAAGKHVWIEKPPAATCAEIDAMESAATAAQRVALVGFKKMFAPANAKARALLAEPDFGQPMLATLEYPQLIPPVEDLRAYLDDEAPLGPVAGFLDHLCHPASLLVSLLGEPDTLSYTRAASGAGTATFTFAGGAVATLLLTHLVGFNGGMERTQVVSDRGARIIVENNQRIRYDAAPSAGSAAGYGSTPDFYATAPAETGRYWEPEHSLGQLYNKGVFALGYCAELHAFAEAILTGTPPALGTLDQARWVTAIFEAFAEGPQRVIELRD